jgi:DNA repair protein RadC
MSKMSDRRKDLRPREKLAARGAAALSDYELLMEVVAYSEKVLLRFISMAEKLPIPRNCSISLLRR